MDISAKIKRLFELRDLLKELVHLNLYNHLDKKSELLKLSMFSSKNNRMKFWNAMDGLHDTNCAFYSFSKIGLTENLSCGVDETYLRLYGFLSVVGLQQKCLITINRGFETGFSDEALSKHKLIWLRNKIGAHPVDKNDDSYSVDRNQLSKGRLLVGIYNEGKETILQEYDIEELILNWIDLYLIMLKNFILKIIPISSKFEILDEVIDKCENALKL